jgi:hypothetical protein
VKATVLAPPAMHQAQTRGFNILADIAALGLPYQATGGASTRTFIRERTDVVRRYIKSHVEALHLFKTDRGTSVSVLAKAFVCPTNSCSKEVMTAQSPSINYRRKQYPSLEGLKTILASDLKARQQRPKTLSIFVSSKSSTRAAISTNCIRGKFLNNKRVNVTSSRCSIF